MQSSLGVPTKRGSHRNSQTLTGSDSLPGDSLTHWLTLAGASAAATTNLLLLCVSHAK